MRILMTNDDGIHSLGLFILADKLKEIGELTIVAPDTERSAVGHSITINHPLRVKEVKNNGRSFGFAVNGTPADCIKLALGAIMDQPADIVISGINLGLNIGTHIMYSGTVSGAMEGAIFGLPAIAVSADVPRDNEGADNDSTEAERLLCFAADYTAEIAKAITQRGLPERTLLNINIPRHKGGIKGAIITKQGQTRFFDHFQKRFDPRKNVYYWLEGEDAEMEGGEGLDYIATKRGFISITPLRCDLTNYGYIDELRKLDMQKILKEIDLKREKKDRAVTGKGIAFTISPISEI